MSKNLSKDKVFDLFIESYFNVSNAPIPIGDDLVKKMMELTEMIYSAIQDGKFELEIPVEFKSMVGKIFQYCKDNLTYLWCFSVKNSYDLEWFPTKEMVYELYQIMENNGCTTC